MRRPWIFTFVFMFLPYVSSAFVPLQSMPSWLHWFAENQPVTPVTKTMRRLLMGTPIGDSALLAAGARVSPRARCSGVGRRIEPE